MWTLFVDTLHLAGWVIITSPCTMTESTHDREHTCALFWRMSSAAGFPTGGLYIYRAVSRDILQTKTCVRRVHIYIYVHTGSWFSTYTIHIYICIHVHTGSWFSTYTRQSADSFVQIKHQYYQLSVKKCSLMQDIKGCANRIVPFSGQYTVAMDGGGGGSRGSGSWHLAS